MTELQKTNGENAEELEIQASDAETEQEVDSVSENEATEVKEAVSDEEVETVEEAEETEVVEKSVSEESVNELIEETQKAEETAEQMLSSSYSSDSDGRESAIRLQNVSMTYDNINMALNDVSLDIKKGEFVFIVGANGAGKTTLTRLLICEERVSSGRLTVNGFQLHKIRSWKVPKLRRTMGMVFQDFKLFDNMTVYENVAFAMRVVGAKSSMIKKRVPVFLEMVGVGHKSNAFPTELSGGEKQRVAFARAIVNNPDIVIADEPTGNIDTKMTEGIMELLLKINKLGKTVIVITHDAQIVKHYNKRVIKLEDGRVVSDKIGGDI